jgi:MFS family permease
VVRCATLAGSCAMGTLVGMTIFVPLYFEVVLHLSASQSGLALIPLMSTGVISSTITGRLMTHVTHYKRMPLIGITVSIVAAGTLAIWPDRMPIALVLTILAVVGLGIGTIFPVSTVCMQNAVPRTQLGVATGSANFFRALVSSLVVAVFGAIVLGGLGGVTGMSVEMLARAASAGELAHAFRFLFLSASLILCFSLSFIVAMEERPLRGPTPPSATAPVAPAAQIPAE